MNKNIILIGMPGAGKTAVGKELSKLLDIKHIDTDLSIESYCGISISRIFATHGESYFRNIEKEVISDSLNDINCVISTGGGAPLDEDNRSLFKSKGYVIYLKASIDTLIYRLDGATDRPLIKSDTIEIKESLAKLYDERRVIYESLADVIIATDALSIAKVAEKIKKQLKYENY